MPFLIFFPLLQKELTREEYALIENITSKTYLIQNEQDGSRFIEVNPTKLFEVYQQIEKKQL